MNTDIHPVYLLNNYVWHVLKENTFMDELDYRDDSKPSGRIPIVPASEQPELASFSSPYLIYGYSLNSGGTMWQQQQGSLSYIVYASTSRQLNKVMNVLVAAFERFDESADNVNRYTSKIPEFRGIRFGEIHLGFAEAGVPEDAPENEGDKQVGLVNIRFTFFVDYNVDLTPNAPSVP